MKKIFFILPLLFLLGCQTERPKSPSGYSLGITQQQSNNNFSSAVQIQKNLITNDPINAATKSTAPPPPAPFKSPPPRQFIVPKSQRKGSNLFEPKFPAPKPPVPMPMQPLPSPQNSNY